MTQQGIYQKWAVMLLALQFCCSVITAQEQSEQAAQSTLNITTSVEDYIRQNQRKFDGFLREYGQRIAEVRVNYLDQVSTIEVHREQLEYRLLLIEEELNPLEVLNDLSKHCVQKYRGELTPVDNAKAALTSCIYSASNYVNSVVSSLENTQRVLTNYYKGALKTALNKCTKDKDTSQQNYTVCVTQAISTANTYTINNQNTFATQLDAAKCAGKSRIQTALRCSFGVLYDNTRQAGKVTSLIEDCIVNNNANEELDNVAKCDRVIYVDRADVDFQNRTIPNPLYGFQGDDLSCLHLEFVNNP